MGLHLGDRCVPFPKLRLSGGGTLGVLLGNADTSDMEGGALLGLSKIKYMDGDYVGRRLGRPKDKDKGQQGSWKRDISWGTARRHSRGLLTARKQCP